MHTCGQARDFYANFSTILFLCEQTIRVNERISSHGTQFHNQEPKLTVNTTRESVLK